MNILCIGDVVSDTGRDHLARLLRPLKKETGADLVIVNGENAALGNGIDRESAEDIFNAGADVITGGNHSFQKKTAGTLLEETPFLLRPENLGNTFGRGWCRVEGRKRDVLIINLQGSLFMPDVQNPFACVDALLEKEARPRDLIVVDFHAEATGEKQAMGYYLDGRISLLFGTHTHVQTNDETVLPGGTGYITDIGMTGPIRSVLGKNIDAAVHNFRCPDDRVPVRDAPSPCRLCGILTQIDDVTGKCINISKISK